MIKRSDVVKAMDLEVLTIGIRDKPPKLAVIRRVRTYDIEPRSERADGPVNGCRDRQIRCVQHIGLEVLSARPVTCRFVMTVKTIIQPLVRGHLKPVPVRDWTGDIHSLSLGLGAWLPTLNFGGRRSIGAVLFGGYAALLASLFLMQAVLGMGLLSTFWIVFAVAVLGLCRLVLRNSGGAAEFVIHPAIILPVAAGILIALRGHIDYLPYTVDEFTNWLGGAKTIHSNGGYAAIRETIYLPGYTPGWRLALLLPWQIDGAMDLGRSAAAGFVLHAGLVAIMFDIVRWEAAERLQLSSAGARPAHGLRFWYFSPRREPGPFGPIHC